MWRRPPASSLRSAHCQVCKSPNPAVEKLIRSEFFEAKIARWSDEKREIVLDGCDPEALGLVVGFMYGTDLTDMVIMHSANTGWFFSLVPPKSSKCQIT